MSHEEKATEELLNDYRARVMLLETENADLRTDIMDLTDVIMGAMYGRFSSIDEWVELARETIERVLDDER
jgi:hypothetical protein